MYTIQYSYRCVRFGVRSHPCPRKDTRAHGHLVTLKFTHPVPGGSWGRIPARCWHRGAVPGSPSPVASLGQGDFVPDANGDRPRCWPCPRGHRRAGASLWAMQESPHGGFGVSQRVRVRVSPGGVASRRGPGQCPPSPGGGCRSCPLFLGSSPAPWRNHDPSRLSPALSDASGAEPLPLGMNAELGDLSRG